MLLQKGKQYQRKVQICNRPYNTDAFLSILGNKDFEEVEIDHIILPCAKLNNQIIVGVPNDVISLFSRYPAIGDLYKCITSISTGDDSKYLSKVPLKGFSIPFYKNPASRKFKGYPDAYLIDTYIEESICVKDFMVRNKPYLNKEGIACSSMGLPFSAVYLPSNGVTGVNPSIFPPKEDIYWMIAYLNSSLVTYIVRAVLIRSNMVTSGYVSCIPVIEFNDDEKEILSSITAEAINGTICQEDAIIMIDNLIFNKNIFCSDTIEEIVRYTKHLAQSV